MKRRIMAVAAAGACALLAAATSHGSQIAATLQGTVGPSFTIGLSKTGHRVTALKAGTYRIVVSDRSSEHNFVLHGPGKTLTLTSVGAMGTKTATVKLGKGTWTYFCAPHADDMRGSFRVT
jgi:plastocyanin